MLKHLEVAPDYDLWRSTTWAVFEHGFGKQSKNLTDFNFAHYAKRNRSKQEDFQLVTAQQETAILAGIEELEMSLPESEIKGVYEPGQEYEFYKGIKTILGFATQELFVVDPYLSKEIFETYADSISRTVKFRLLGANIPSDVVTLGQKYAGGQNFQLRSSNSIHDRMIFVDQRVWACGQSLKDAAKKKPTYIVEIDEALMRLVYEAIWAASQAII